MKRSVSMEFNRADLIAIRHALFMVDSNRPNHNRALLERVTSELHAMCAMSDETKKKLRDAGLIAWEIRSRAMSPMAGEPRRK